MNKYQVMLRGENFLLDFVDEERKHGFFTTVWVEAKDTDEAELNAVTELRKHEDLKMGLLNKPDDAPMIYLEEMREIDSDSEVEENRGRTFFSENDEEGRYEAKQLELEALWN